MGMISVKIQDVSGNRSRNAELPDDVSINRLLVLLVEKMKLPLNSPDGQIMSYKLHRRQTGRQLLDNETLADVGIQYGEDLRIQPEITAGRNATDESYK